jgi:hypothetical protein
MILIFDIEHAASRRRSFLNMQMQAQAEKRENAFVTTKGLLQTVLARLDRQEGQLAAMSTTLQHLDSALDGRLARALASALRPQSAEGEQPLADSLAPAKSKPDGGCNEPEHSHGGWEPAHAGQEIQEIAGRLQSPSATPGPRSAISAMSKTRHCGAPVPATQARSRAGLAKTQTMKHSFLRRLNRLGEEEQQQSARRLRRASDRALESVFGICEADPRMGKEGSRAIHPQSHFVTGERDSDGPAPPGPGRPGPARAADQLEVGARLLGLLSPCACRARG